MPKGILKHAEDQSTSARGIKWDEDNLLITEAGKGATMKIDEPKTPYIRYDSANDMILGSSGSVPPLELSFAIEEAREQQAASHHHHQNRAARGSSDTDSQGSASRRRVSVDEWGDDSEDENMDPKEAEKHRKFEQLRASHYDMKSALHPASVKTRKPTKNGRVVGVPPGVVSDDDSDDNDDDDVNDNDEEEDTEGGEEADDERDGDDGGLHDADEEIGQGEIRQLADMRLGPAGGGLRSRVDHHQPPEMDLS
ncbi:hypothetical protein HDU87_003011 [Geranomyces variabilis]|uniref:Protein phosphatase inhibitor 2 n=1 Tax=Geranomyces variabilis TaxID=109894 RepID=A0AAD5XNJ9_9FUNG|nr:hypothetical protein HDU87_003011 [Geranomyces variabilis]